jgi:hypothetical protein
MPKALTVHASAEQTISFTFQFYFVPQRLPPVDLVLAPRFRCPLAISQIRFAFAAGGIVFLIAIASASI